MVNNEKGNIIINFINTTKTNIEVYNITECDTFIISVTAMVTHYTSIANTEMNNGSKYSICDKNKIITEVIDDRL